jgi:P27 family predicted phage terminase small subunit
VLKGNPGRRPLNDKEPQPRTDPPRCPQWINKVAKDKWKAIVPELKAMGVLTYVDGDALANYCQIWARWRAAEEFIQRHGDVLPIKDDTGRVKYLQQVPQVSIARNLVQVLNRYQQEFGLTPSARTRIHAKPQDKKNDKERFFKTA